MVPRPRYRNSVSTWPSTAQQCLLGLAIYSLACSAHAAASPTQSAQAAALSPEDKLSTSIAPSLSDDLRSGTWGSCSALQLARQDFQAVVLQGGSLKGKVLVLGGCCNGASSLASSELFSPGDNSWHTMGDLNSPRWLFQAVALPSGSALAIGGLSIAKGGVLNSTELFTPAKDGSQNGTWSQVSAMNTPRQDFAAILLDDGTVLAVGGFMASTEIYDPVKDQWTQTSRMSMQEARSAFELVKLPNGKVLAVGGRGRSSNMLASSEVFDPTTKTWQAQGSMNEARASFSLVLLSDGKVMAAGGRGDGNTVLNSTEIYDPATGNWTAAPDMVYHRALQQAISLPSGKVLMAGGLGGLGDGDIDILDTAETFDAAIEDWELTDAMISGRYVFQLVSLPNGTAMAVGGTGPRGFTSSTELFLAS